MDNTKLIGWKKLTDSSSIIDTKGLFQLPAYSEFMPSPKVGVSPYGEIDSIIFKEDDIFGWHISEIEEENELKPGLNNTGRQIMEHIMNLGKGFPEHYLSGHSGLNLLNNPYWPPELAEYAGKLFHEKYVAFLPFALSRTQDDKGRVNWTFFGASETGPENVFWKSFYFNPDEELPESKFLEVFSRIFSDAYGENVKTASQLLKLEFRYLPSENNKTFPSWSKNYIINENSSFDNIKYLLTFRPFSTLPSKVKENYFSGKLSLLPFPGSLVFWGMPTFLKLQIDLPGALQIPMLRTVARHRGNSGIRVPQSGWIHEPHPDLNPSHVHHGLILDTYHRTHRWQRIEKNVDELSLQPRVAKIAKVLFSTSLDSMGLYDKPMARNCQLWTKDFTLLLDGPNSNHNDIKNAEKIIEEGGLFGYRFYFPPMQVGKYNIFWYRPLVTFLSSKTNKIELFPDLMTGYLTALPDKSADLNEIVELWPRLYKRKPYLNAIHNFINKHDHYSNQTVHNIINLLYHFNLLEGKPLPRSFARHLLRLNKKETFEVWLSELKFKTNKNKFAEEVVEEIEKIVENSSESPSFYSAITFNDTNRRAFEESWWNDINFLAHGKFVNKDNADCVLDEVTSNKIQHHHRDLEKLGDYFIERHRNIIKETGMESKAFCGELPFKWNTDFEFTDFGGWIHNKEGQTYERNILVIIPGKNHEEAVILADHYDTAYMEDVFDIDSGGSGARISAAGADDNYSASATLLQSAPIFMKLSKEGKLERDIWLLHLTGEEFPSDCMGARNFCKAVLEKNLKLYLDKDNFIDLSIIKIAGVFVMDMIGHNRDDDKDIFQISPGKSLHSVKLALHAHIANMLWNENTHEWNKREERKNADKGKRITGDEKIPAIAKHLPLIGEVRTQFDPFSSIYNTDGQIFSDIGIPVVLFMENYDLHRTGYHDTKDTVENIDMDYGAALAAIAIETVARVASIKKI